MLSAIGLMWLISSDHSSTYLCSGSDGLWWCLFESTNVPVNGSLDGSNGAKDGSVVWGAIGSYFTSNMCKYQ